MLARYFCNYSRPTAKSSPRRRRPLGPIETRQRPSGGTRRSFLRRGRLRRTRTPLGATAPPRGGRNDRINTPTGPGPTRYSCTDGAYGISPSVTETRRERARAPQPVFFRRRRSRRKRIPLEAAGPPRGDTTPVLIRPIARRADTVHSNGHPSAPAAPSRGAAVRRRAPPPCAPSPAAASLPRMHMRRPQRAPRRRHAAHTAPHACCCWPPHGKGLGSRRRGGGTPSQPPSGCPEGTPSGADATRPPPIDRSVDGSLSARSRAAAGPHA